MLWWFLSEFEGRAYGRGVFVQSCNIVWTGGHGDSTPQETFTKTFLPVPTPRFLCISPRSQALGGSVLRVSASSLSTSQVKAADKDRLGLELNFAGREPRCKKNPSVASRGRDSGRALHPTPAGPKTIQGQRAGMPEVTCSLKKKPETLGPWPALQAHVPSMDPRRRSSRSGQRALGTLAPRSKMFCAILCKAHGDTSHPRVLQTPEPLLSTVQICFPPCHCANTQVFFGNGTRLTVVGKTAPRSLLAPGRGQQVQSVHFGVVIF